MKKSLVVRGIMALGMVLVALFAFLFTSANVSADQVELTKEGAVVTANAFGIGALNKGIFERGAEYFNYLLDNKPDLFDTQFVTDYRKGDKTLKGGTYFVRSKIGIDSVVKVIEPSDVKKKDGYTNLQDGQIEKGTYFVLTDIEVKYGTAASGELSAANVLTNSLIHDNTTVAKAGLVDLDSGATGNQFAALAVQRIPTKLVNAEYKLKVGSEVIQEGLMSDFFINNLNGVAVPGNHAVALRACSLIKEGETITFDIYYPAGVTDIDGSINHYIHLNLIGDRVRSRKA